MKRRTVAFLAAIAILIGITVLLVSGVEITFTSTKEVKVLQEALNPLATSLNTTFKYRIKGFKSYSEESYSDYSTKATYYQFENLVIRPKRQLSENEVFQVFEYIEQLGKFQASDGITYNISSSWHNGPRIISDNTTYTISWHWDDYDHVIDCENNTREWSATKHIKDEPKPSTNSSSSSGSSTGEKCYWCNGTGSVRYNYGSSDLEAILSGHDPYTYGTCASCGGTGKAK